MSATDVAVVVPVYNRRRIVLQALASVARQTAPPGRLIVVDDGSTDGSLAEIRDWLAAQRLPFRVALVGQPNRGVAAARNRGLAEAEESRHVAFLDSDDGWPDDFLERTRRALSRAPHAVAATCDRWFVNPDTGPEPPQSLAGLARNATPWLMRFGGAVSSCSLFRADLVRDLGGFREDLLTGEDTDLFLRLSLAGPWLHVPGTPVTLSHGHALRCGEADHLSRHFTDNFRRWARVLEEFLEGQAGRQAVSRRFARFVVGRCWYLAGEELLARGCLTDARACFARSWSYRRFWIRPLLALGKTWRRGQAA